MFTEPKLSDRAEQPYLGIRVQVPISELGKVIPENHRQVYTWLREKGIKPSGAPFIRFHIINMPGLMDIELGVPVEQRVAGNGQIKAGVLPEGRYAALVYTGVNNGIEGNRRLLEWGEKKGLVWDTYESDKGDGFGARYESFLTEPDDEPDMAKWETEVAIRLADK